MKILNCATNLQQASRCKEELSLTSPVQAELVLTSAMPRWYCRVLFETPLSPGRFQLLPWTAQSMQTVPGGLPELQTLSSAINHCIMTPTAELAIAKANAFLALARAKAVSASRLLAYVVLRYGVHVARRIAEQLVQLLRRAVLRLQLAYQCLQRPQQFQQQVNIFSAWRRPISYCRA